MKNDFLTIYGDGVSKNESRSDFVDGLLSKDE